MSGPLILTAPYYDRLDDLERRHWWCRSVRRVNFDLSLSRLPDRGTVLDAGCGAGGMLLHLATRRPNVRGVGLDLSADALRLARRKGLRFLQLASVTELPIASESVDLLFSNDVLQHLPEGDDARALEEARRVLKPGGLLCMRANFGRLAEGEQGVHRRYDRRRLAQLVRGAGFTIEKHLVLHPLPAMLAPRRHARHAGHGGGGLAMSVPPEPINRLLAAYTLLEDAVTRRLPFAWPIGDAQTVLARRQS